MHTLYNSKNDSIDLNFNFSKKSCSLYLHDVFAFNDD